MADTPARRLFSMVPRRTRAARVARAARRSGFVLGLVAAASLACSHHLRLTSPDTDPGSRYECSGSGSGECRPRSSDVPSDDNPSGTTAITLPRECAGKIHQILIIDAGSSEPAVRVTCAPAEEPLRTMDEPEARLSPRER
jgi:hypothetical protein